MCIGLDRLAALDILVRLVLQREDAVELGFLIGGKIAMRRVGSGLDRQRAVLQLYHPIPKDLQARAIVEV